MKVKEMKRILSMIDERAQVYVLDGKGDICTLRSVDLEFPDDGDACVNIRIAEEGSNDDF